MVVIFNLNLNVAPRITVRSNFLNPTALTNHVTLLFPTLGNISLKICGMALAMNACRYQ
jgi:hypothetical protein